MITLETPIAGPQASSVLTSESISENPTIVLDCPKEGRIWRGAKKPDGTRLYEPDPNTLIQTIGYMREGKFVGLQGTVPKEQGIKCSAAWRVVYEVDFKPAWDSPGMELQIVRVIEVWAAPGKKLWSAKGDLSTASPKAASMDAGGKITRAA